jgi:ferredoxin
MRIRVNTALCSGHARCAAVAGAVYHLNDDGYCISDGAEVPDGMEALAQRGARACPERAITLTDDKTS